MSISVLMKSWYEDMRMASTFHTKKSLDPTFFVPSKKESKYKTLDGECVEPIKPGTISRL